MPKVRANPSTAFNQRLVEYIRQHPGLDAPELAKRGYERLMPTERAGLIEWRNGGWYTTSPQEVS
jgi:hypothetical protein